jgi:acetyltransferase-like isoleucine patch superfamily enzyme
MRALLKAACNALATLAVLPAFLLYRLGRAAMGEAAFAGWSQALSRVPGVRGVYQRRAFYRLALAECAPDASVGFGTILSRPGTRIGRGVYIGAYCSLDEVVIEDDVLIASRVSLMSGGREHGIDRLDVPIRFQPGRRRRVTIGADSWIGEGAIVMADVGRQCVVGAGAVVTRPVPDRAIAVGVPARVIAFRDGRAAPAADGLGDGHRR